MAGHITAFQVLEGQEQLKKYCNGEAKVAEEKVETEEAEFVLLAKQSKDACMGLLDIGEDNFIGNAFVTHFLAYPFVFGKTALFEKIATALGIPMDTPEQKLAMLKQIVFQQTGITEATKAYCDLHDLSDCYIERKPGEYELHCNVVDGMPDRCYTLEDKIKVVDTDVAMVPIESLGPAVA